MEFLTIIYILAAAHGVILALALILSKKKANFFLGGLVATLTLALLHNGILWDIGYYTKETKFYWAGMCYSFLFIAPFFYYYILFCTQPERPWQLKDWCFFLPGILSLGIVNLHIIIGQITGNWVMPDSLFWGAVKLEEPLGAAMSIITIWPVWQLIKKYHQRIENAFSDIEQIQLHWLPLEVNDVYLAYGSGYYQINEQNAIGLGVRYFSLGEIGFTNAAGVSLGNGKPNELEFNLSYARKLTNRFSGGLGLKYIYSDLAAGQEVGGESITAGKSIAMDFSFTYQTPALTIGLAATNLGQKITYTNSVNKDFIPGNLGIGIAWNKQLNENNKLTLTTDINKLLAPTPDSALTDADGDGVPDYKQKDYLPSIFGSFSDAPGGFSEELRELMFSFGGELLFQDFLAVRAGYFTEHSTKGNRKYLTIGLGYTYKFVTLNGSYLVTTSNQENPLDNTFRVSLLFKFGKQNFKKTG